MKNKEIINAKHVIDSWIDVHGLHLMQKDQVYKVIT